MPIVCRGESIKHGHPERLRAFCNVLRVGFPTEFINGGNPYLVASLGAFDAAILHVATNFKIGEKRHLKHFISFSEDRQIALKYAHGKAATSEYIEEVETRLEYHNISSGLVGGSFDFSQLDDCDHMIVALNLEGATSIDPNFDYCYIKEYNNGSSKILAINAAEYFRIQIERMGRYATDNLRQAFEYSRRDSEWLVLALDLIPAQPGIPASSSGILKHGEPLTIEVCVDSLNTSFGDSARFL